MKYSPLKLSERIEIIDVLRGITIFGILAAHVVLLWAGDILVFYALFGFLMILFRKSSDREVFKWTVWLTLIPTILSLLMMVMVALFSMVPEARTGMESVIFTSVFYSYGFGLYGKIAAWQGILLTIVIFTAQVFFSRWWLGRYRFGPFEWLWRSLTYWKVQPIKRNLQDLK